ncbi:helix-turn-helix domain-containing protein [Lentilactobacillus sp. G22-6]|uniref:helix-turn-helix domain-containing protein n=1 Tax=Lentilactobacillus dabitei TaxID=2831523 RepID=UPI001C25AB95|nr:helix-turn-helix transcriptional regulator [Lentilactobacillus dabitei]MBU9790342.1 helix-turn-helix domain-containing protein [Lentilactobacillus dabitei]
MTKNNLSILIVNRIKELRKQRNLTQDQLSELADLQIKYMNRIENFKTGLTIKTLDKIIEALGVDYQTFFNFESEVDFPNGKQIPDAELLKIATDIQRDAQALKNRLKQIK